MSTPSCPHKETKRLFMFQGKFTQKGGGTGSGHEDENYEGAVEASPVSSRSMSFQFL